MLKKGSNTRYGCCSLKLAAQIVMVLVLMLVFGLVPSLLDGDGEVALVVDAD